MTSVSIDRDVEAGPLASNSKDLCGCFYGRYIRDWSHYLIIAGGVIDVGLTGYTEARLALDPTPPLGAQVAVGVAGVAILVFFAITYFRITSLKPLKKLQEEVDDIGREGDELGKTNEQLVTALAHANQTIVDLRRDFDEKVVEIDRVTSALTQVQKELQKVSLLYEKYQIIANVFANEFGLFSQHRHAMSFENGQLREINEHCDQNELKLLADLKKFHQMDILEDAEREKLQKLTEKMSSDFGVMRQSLLDTQTQLTELQTQVNNLKLVGNQMDARADRIEKVAGQLRDLLRLINNLSEDSSKKSLMFGSDGDTGDEISDVEEMK